MKPIERGEVLGLAEYEAIREQFRKRVIGEKKLRRVSVGRDVTVLFENRDTVLMQIQEMLRTERITREGAILHEIETYNQLLPGADELSSTLMIEIPDAAARDAFLARAKGFERHVALVVAGRPFPAKWDPSRVLESGTSAVHYLKFPLERGAAASLRGCAGSSATLLQVEITIDHPEYAARAVLAPETIVSIAEDLAAS
jgi:hypothetical protein